MSHIANQYGPYYFLIGPISPIKTYKTYMFLSAHGPI